MWSLRRTVDGKCPRPTDMNWYDWYFPRWWFQFFLFSPLFGEDFPFWLIFFQMSCFNHQLEIQWDCFLFILPILYVYLQDDDGPTHQQDMIVKTCPVRNLCSSWPGISWRRCTLARGTQWWWGWGGPPAARFVTSGGTIGSLLQGLGPLALVIR